MIVSELHFTGIVLSALRDNLDSAVYASVAIQGDRCGILEHYHIVNFIGGKIRNVTLYSVNKNQRRIVVVQCLKASDIESRVLLGVNSGTLKRDQAKALAKNTVTYVLGITMSDVSGSYYRNGRSHLLHAQRRGSSRVDYLLLRLIHGVISVLCGKSPREHGRQSKYEYVFLFHFFH